MSSNYGPGRVCLALLSARIFASLRQAESHPDVRHRGLPNRPASDSLRREETGARRHEHSDRFSGRLLLRGSPQLTPVERGGVSAHALVDWRIEPAPSTPLACCRSGPKGDSSHASPFGRGLYDWQRTRPTSQRRVRSVRAEPERVSILLSKIPGV